MIITRTPLRISLCGGGTDIPSYYKHNEYGAVCSFAIDKYVYIMAKPLPEEFNCRYKLAYFNAEMVQTQSEIKHTRLKEIIKDYPAPLDLSCMADIPAGTGLGSSSTFTVGVLHALSLQKHILLTKEELAQKACEIEINRLGEPIGKQDQYAAAYGGLNYFQFNSDNSVLTEPIVLDPERERRFMSTLRLYYLGTPARSASEVLRERKDYIDVLEQMKVQAKQCVEILTHGTPQELGLLLRGAWEMKKQLSPFTSTPQIDQIYVQALAQGAWGGKLLGAGQSGFLLLACPVDTKLDLGLKRFDFNIDYVGSVSYAI